MNAAWILCLITAAQSQSTETTTTSPNVTTLYPTNKTLTRNVIDGKNLEKYPQTWKLEAVFSESNLTQVDANNSTDSKEQKDIGGELSAFKPSEHLGSFFDEDDAEVIDTPIIPPVNKIPASGFVSSVKDEYHTTFNQVPKEIFQTHKELPYQFEDPTYLPNYKPNWREESIDSKPTVEAPTKIPAGGLYKSPGAFKEKPNIDEEFGLDILDDGKEVAIKRRVNPWKNVLRLVTALIPAGLIISALTPSVITIHNIDNKRERVGVVRRSDSSLQNLSPISEQCRRRLLCEIHSDRYYTHATSKGRGVKHCYKIHCEDTEALWKMLRWLFTYNRPEDDAQAEYLT